VYDSHVRFCKAGRAALSALGCVLRSTLLQLTKKASDEISVYE
jgi:hypothetical protein